MVDISPNNLPIGFFDSGVGGVSVLAEAASALPNESFIYYGDSGHAPYGTKDAAEVKELSLRAVDFLTGQGIKALVVACNTATSVAIEDLRQKLDLPVIGMEPALKPAVEMGEKGVIVVMATPVTLREKKFNDLLDQYREEKEIIPLSCPGLVELIEQGFYSGKRVEDYLQDVFSPVVKDQVGAVVLGCTHYVFLKNEIRKFLSGARLIDGNQGTVRQLRRLLSQRKALSDLAPEMRTISYFTSADPDIFLPLCRRLFDLYLKK